MLLYLDCASSFHFIDVGCAFHKYMHCCAMRFNRGYCVFVVSLICSVFILNFVVILSCLFIAELPSRTDYLF